MRLSRIIRSAVLCGVCIAVSLSLAPAQGAFIASETATVTPLMGGTSYLYSYTVTVSALSTVSASEFDLALNAPIDPNSIISPSNFFSFYTLGDPFITFTAFDNGTAANGISPGSSGTFSFTSAYAPAMASYQVVGLDPSFTTDIVAGATLAPSVVPEPSSLLLASLGMGGILGGFLRSRRRSTHSAGA